MSLRILLLWLALCAESIAGTDCREWVPSPAIVAEAAGTALRVAQALEARDAPVALLARAGTDLSKHGLHYSHVGFVLRDHPDGRWTVVHLLNECGTAKSGVYAEGLVNFFLDARVSQDARIVWLDAQFAQALAKVAREASLVHQPHYNLIARFDSRGTQNSTAWVLDTLGVARGARTRPQAQALVAGFGFAPDLIHVPYAKRVMGGLFTANVDFTDHPIGTRLRGEYPVVTERAIHRWLAASGAIASSIEWRDGRLWTAGPD